MTTRYGLKGRALGGLAAAVVSLGALSGCSSDSGGSGSADAGFVGGDGTIVQLPVEDRREPIDLSGTTLEGEPLDIASLRGAPVVLNVWGSWCGPCRKEAPDLEAAHRELKQDGVAFVGIDFRDKNTAQALAFQRTFDITYPSLSDPNGKLLLQLRGAVTAKSIPSTLILDEQGRIAARISGVTTKTTLIDLVESVSAASAESAAAG